MGAFDLIMSFAVGINAPVGVAVPAPSATIVEASPAASFAPCDEEAEPHGPFESYRVSGRSLGRPSFAYRPGFDDWRQRRDDRARFAHEERLSERERVRLIRHLEILGARERARLEEYLARRGASPHQIVAERARLARKQALRDARDLARLAEKQRARAASR